MLISGFLNYTLGGGSPVGVDMIEKPTHKKANPTTIFTTNNYIRKDIIQSPNKPTIKM